MPVVSAIASYDAMPYAIVVLVSYAYVPRLFVTGSFSTFVLQNGFENAQQTANNSEHQH